MSDNIVNIYDYIGADGIEVIKAGNFTISKPINTIAGGDSFNHNLGYIPGLLVYYTDQDLFSFDQIPYAEFTNTGLVALHFNVLIDETSVAINYFTPDVAGSSIYDNAYTFYFRYYLLRLGAS